MATVQETPTRNGNNEIPVKGRKHRYSSSTGRSDFWEGIIKAEEARLAELERTQSPRKTEEAENKKPKLSGAVAEEEAHVLAHSAFVSRAEDLPFPKPTIKRRQAHTLRGTTSEFSTTQVSSTLQRAQEAEEDLERSNGSESSIVIYDDEQSLSSDDEKGEIDMGSKPTISKLRLDLSRVSSVPEEIVKDESSSLEPKLRAHATKTRVPVAHGPQLRSWRKAVGNTFLTPMTGDNARVFVIATIEDMYFTGTTLYSQRMMAKYKNSSLQLGPLLAPWPVALKSSLPDDFNLEEIDDEIEEDEITAGFDSDVNSAPRRFSSPLISRASGTTQGVPSSRNSSAGSKSKDGVGDAFNSSRTISSPVLSPRVGPSSQQNQSNHNYSLSQNAQTALPPTKASSAPTQNSNSNDPEFEQAHSGSSPKNQNSSLGKTNNDIATNKRPAANTGLLGGLFSKFRTTRAGAAGASNSSNSGNNANISPIPPFSTHQNANQQNTSGSQNQASLQHPGTLNPSPNSSPSNNNTSNASASTSNTGAGAQTNQNSNLVASTTAQPALVTAANASVLAKLRGKLLPWERLRARFRLGETAPTNSEALANGERSGSHPATIYEESNESSLSQSTAGISKESAGRPKNSTNRNSFALPLNTLKKRPGHKRYTSMGDRSILSEGEEPGTIQSEDEDDNFDEMGEDEAAEEDLEETLDEYGEIIHRRKIVSGRDRRGVRQMPSGALFNRNRSKPALAKEIASDAIRGPYFMKLQGMSIQMSANADNIQRLNEAADESLISLNSTLERLTVGHDRLEVRFKKLSRQMEYTRQKMQSGNALLRDNIQKASKAIEHLRFKQRARGPMRVVLAVLGWVVLIVGTLIWLIAATYRATARGVIFLFAKLFPSLNAQQASAQTHKRFNHSNASNRRQFSTASGSNEGTKRMINITLGKQSSSSSLLSGPHINSNASHMNNNNGHMSGQNSSTGGSNSVNGKFSAANNLINGLNGTQSSNHSHNKAIGHRRAASSSSAAQYFSSDTASPPLGFGPVGRGVNGAPISPRSKEASINANGATVGSDLLQLASGSPASALRDVNSISKPSRDSSDSSLASVIEKDDVDEGAEEYFSEVEEDNISALGRDPQNLSTGSFNSNTSGTSNSTNSSTWTASPVTSFAPNAAAAKVEAQQLQTLEDMSKSIKAMRMQEKAAKRRAALEKRKKGE